MLQNDELDGDEIVVRVLIRTPAEMYGETKRQPLDAADFMRRLTHPKTKQAENGISLLRKKVLPTFEEIYNYIGSKKFMGIAECKLSQLTAREFKYIITGRRREHLSLRCPECDKNDLSSTKPCYPIDAAQLTDCRLFASDPFDLHKIFQLKEAPAIRPVNKI